MLTRQQLYELYHEGARAMIGYVEGLLEYIADQDRILGHHQQRIIDIQHERLARQATQIERVKDKLWKQQRLNYQLLRRVQELQTELESVRQGQGEVMPVQARRDSHNSGLPPSLDLPSVKAANAVKRTRSLRRKSGKSVGGQVGHKGATLRQVEMPDHVQVHEPRLCRRCHSSLRESSVVGRHRRQVFDLPPVVLEVTEHWAQVKRCNLCGVRTKAKFPQDVRAPVQYGGRVRAVATYLHKYQLLPLARTSEGSPSRAARDGT